MSNKKSFLHCVARTFHNQYLHDLKDFCFIFPNRRSGVFFEKELIECSQESFILPHITTISDFLSDTSGLVECNKIESILDLYEEYCSIAGDNAESFDEFSYWGNIILSDFNDLDLYLVDANKLFTNLKEYKEIGTDYLTDEQKNVLKEYFGESYALSNSGIDNFWKHTNNNSEHTSEYLYIWEMLGVLYERFNKRLQNKGVTYTGQIYRKSVEILKTKPVSDFQHKQYIFVGFNVLSTSEYHIFSILKDKGIADFYWDLNSPALRDSNNKASLFINKNIINFKSKLNIEEEPIETFPHIEAKAIPSNVGQVKYAASIIETLKNEKKISNPNNLLDTAIVLPDENLFIPLSGSLDKEKLGPINITMGFPLKQSLIASLLTTISKTHRQSRNIRGEYCYYIEDIKSIFSHPYIKLITGDEIVQLQKRLQSERLFFIPFKTLKETCPSLVELFLPITEISITELIKYTENILNFISGKIVTKLDKDHNNSIELTCVQKYIEQFYKFVDIISNYNIKLNENTFFFLIDRFVSNSTVSLQGEPLEGLQIMGVLETRCLDFRNIIIPSMNERVFPKKHFSRSFIPYTIRKSFGMATIEHQECMYAYYFYRMISRAENVYLLYDARTTGLGSGDASRYIQQLCKVYSESNTRIEHVSFDISSTQDLEIAVPKTNRIMDKLNVYRTQDSGKYLSASSINTYILCPLKFYFEKVEGLYIDDEISEFMSNSTFGTIIHEIMLNIYNPLKNRVVTKDYIESYIHNQNHCLDKLITRIVNREFYGKGDNCFDELDGEGYMIEDVIKHYITEILKYDSMQEFTYLQGEESGENEEKGYWADLGINFKQYIDRVDSIQTASSPLLRIIDYKTGGDKTSVSSFATAMDNSKDKIHKAIIQIFLYCNFYNYIRKIDTPIKPLIYTVKDMSQAEIKINRNVINDYHTVNDDFMEQIQLKINEMFDINTPFKQTKNENNCTYCKFKDFCRK